jgi:hypothetical protein
MPASPLTRSQSSTSTPTARSPHMLSRSNTAVRVRVGGGFVVQHDPNAGKDVEKANAALAAAKEDAAAAKEQVLRLQRKASDATARLAACQTDMEEMDAKAQAQAKAHDAELTRLSARLGDLEGTNRALMLKQEEQQAAMERMIAQRSLPQTPQDPGGWEEAYHNERRRRKRIEEGKREVEAAVEAAHAKLDAALARTAEVTAELTESEQQRAKEIRSAHSLQDELIHRCEEWQARATAAEASLREASAKAKSDSAARSSGGSDAEALRAERGLLMKALQERRGACEELHEALGTVLRSPATLKSHFSPSASTAAAAAAALAAAATDDSAACLADEHAPEDRRQGSTARPTSTSSPPASSPPSKAPTWQRRSRSAADAASAAEAAASLLAGVVERQPANAEGGSSADAASAAASLPSSRSRAMWRAGRRGRGDRQLPFAADSYRRAAAALGKAAAADDVNGCGSLSSIDDGLRDRTRLDRLRAGSSSRRRRVG